MAQDEKTIIRSLFDPKIKLDLLQVEDIFTATSEKVPNGPTTTGQQYQHELGTDYPFISINDYTFSSGEILLFKIDATGFLPQLTFIFSLHKTDAFRSQSYPKDGDIVSVFLRAKNDSFKPIRNDYIIKNVDSGRGGVENSGGDTVISAELFVPHIKDELIVSHKGETFQVLQQIAKKLELGFASNETSTNDSQTWINAGGTWENYIKHVASASWKDEKSFYKCYIDVYYHLNFINVNNQLEGDGQLAAGLLDVIGVKDFYANEVNDTKLAQQSVGKFISNMDNFKGTNMFVQQYQTRNESTRIHEAHGYKYNVQFFDQKSLKYWNLFVDPITSEGAEKKKIILKGRTFPKSTDQTDANGQSPSQQDYWKTQNKFVWKGIQTKNVHDKYTYAISHNERNLLELKKLYIEADVQRWNPNIYMGEKVPILLISQADVTKSSADAQGLDKKAVNHSGNFPAVIDQFYSGYYMINGMSITYNQDHTQYSTAHPDENNGYEPAFFQTFTMTRREWPTPLG